MRAVVIGANGQLGTDVCVQLAEEGYAVVPYAHSQLEVADRDAVERRLLADIPGAIVNTAAMHHVEQCEERPLDAFRVNAVGARNVALAAAKINAYLIHVSTDYVFDGAKGSPYVESDLPHPLNVYGTSKLGGEHFVAALSSRSLVMRVSAIYGHTPCRAKGSNFVELMLRLSRERDELRVVDNEFVSPTSTVEIARQILRLLASPVYGVCHATAEGACSWHAFAAEILNQTGTASRLSVAAPDEFPVKTPRPLYSVLENRVLREKGLNVFKSWQEGLAEYLSSRDA